MKIALLQDEIYLPTYGGGIKANRYLMEGLARNGHKCRAFARALTRSNEGPRTEEAFHQELQARNVLVRTNGTDVFTFDYEGVQVEAMNSSDEDSRQAHLAERLAEMQPDWVLVADDKRQLLLEAAMRAVPDRVILLVQTIVQLPFGPLSVCPSSRITDLMHRTAGMFVISEFARDYVRAHADIEPRLIHLPVYGPGPFPHLARHDHGYVTMINPCSLKGVEIFLEVVERFPDVAFATVPTWGASQALLEQLRSRSNVQILAPDDNVETIWQQTRVLLVPSQWPETFGYVVPEAMLRGIPVIASNVGGLPEAKLGVEYLVDVAPGEWRDGSFYCSPQRIDGWLDALERLLTSRQIYEDCSKRSRQAALEFIKTATVEVFETHLEDLARRSKSSTTTKDSDTEENPGDDQVVHPELQRRMDDQPYYVTLDGIHLTVDRDVFPPDLGRCAQNMARLICDYRPQSALDMGCGTGYLALRLKQSGVPTVWAADVHRPAVECARKNAEANSDLGAIHVVQSDLLESIPAGTTFDLIVFNQPFGPGQGQTICGCGSDGGYSITRRFLETARDYLHAEGVLIMAFSDREHQRHSPETVARELGFRVQVVLHQYYGESNNYIYEIRPPA